MCSTIEFLFDALLISVLAVAVRYFNMNSTIVQYTMARFSKLTLSRLYYGSTD